ncbi:GNAT family N-acetyltransferase [Herbaspirillum robiniae]|uniref:GNAT family N-acetyltransferase n=1 Tax=Herbaspirillum robiniae TaxID=2014887 RepID=A0A246WJW2_9BURK|nr:GNAT family N-acetyltransferase [Herbaspirillum robiniae]NUU03755.1 GNAT family N-acetyltransferase [Herbaspirillum robiniae]OWY26494.1 GNAT family N-acetyltransferase [Herbaspirillum robiniae]
MNRHIDRDRQIIYCDRHIEVRPLGLREAAALYDAVHRSKRAISEWEAWCTQDYSLADAKQFLQRSIEQWSVNAAYDFNVIERSTGLIVGSVAVNQISQLNQLANLGYWVREGYTGRGIAVTAARAAAGFAFAKTGLTRLEIVAQAGNLRSQRVAEKTGATLECLARNRLVFHGEPRDAKVFSLVPSDLGLSVPAAA